MSDEDEGRNWDIPEKFLSFQGRFSVVHLQLSGLNVLADNPLVVTLLVPRVRVQRSSAISL